MGESLRSYLEFAVETAYLAGRSTLAHFGTGVQTELKGDQTPVTIADRQAEELIRSRIERTFPGHGIVGEEFGVKEAEGSRYRWFVDPIDGTKSFVRGVPLYAVLIGLEIDELVPVGVAYFPAAALGEGCWWNGRQARVSTVPSLDQAVVAFTDAASFAAYGRLDEWERIKGASYYRAGWGDAYGYLLVATGRVEVMLDPIMSPWDCAPFPPILGEAGGYFGDWQGNQTIFAGEAMATTQALLPEVLAQMGGE
jgi:histidinol-phosphatase